jgi:hypothetical protein
MTNTSSPDPQTCRLLRRLSAPGAWLAAAPPDLNPANALTASGITPAVADYHVVSQAGRRTNLAIPQELIEAATARGWIAEGEGRITLTAAGAKSLRRVLAGGGEPEADSEVPRPRLAVSQLRREPTKLNPGVNEAESPLGWLRRRKDKSGQSLLSDEQFTAGERLRADVFFAGLSPRLTMDWDRSGGSAPAKRSAPGGSAQMLDSMMGARQRVTHAMKAVGPEMSGILLDVCGFMKGLENIESERGWPPRSGKIVLLHALSILARHYGLTKPGATSRRSPGTRHWGGDGYRPDIAAWDAPSLPPPPGATKH